MKCGCGVEEGGFSECGVCSRNNRTTSFCQESDVMDEKPATGELRSSPRWRLRGNCRLAQEDTGLPDWAFIWTAWTDVGKKSLTPNPNARRFPRFRPES